MPKLKDFCWVCLREHIETPSTGKTYGYPVCDKHKDSVDPEDMEEFVIGLFK